MKLDIGLGSSVRLGNRLEGCQIISRIDPRFGRIVKRGGQIMILDLLKHNFEQAHKLYVDRWLGFAESDLHRWLEDAGFRRIEISVVAREEQPPHFQTILASGEKGEGGLGFTAAASGASRSADRFVRAFS